MIGRFAVAGCVVCMLIGCAPQIVRVSIVPQDRVQTECHSVHASADAKGGFGELTWEVKEGPPWLAALASENDRSQAWTGVAPPGSTSDYDLVIAVTDALGQSDDWAPMRLSIEPPSVPVPSLSVIPDRVYQGCPVRFELWVEKVDCEIRWDHGGTLAGWLTLEQLDETTWEIRGDAAQTGEHHLRFRARDGQSDWSNWVEQHLTVLQAPPPPTDPQNCFRTTDDPPHPIVCTGPCEVWLATGDHACPEDPNDGNLLGGLGDWFDRPHRYELSFGRTFLPCEIDRFWILVDTCGLGYNPNACRGSNPPNQHCRDDWRVNDTMSRHAISRLLDIHATTACGELEDGEWQRFTDDNHIEALADGKLTIELLPDNLAGQSCTRHCDRYCVDSIRVIIQYAEPTQ